MSEDNNQNLKEKEVTLNLTEEELEEYKTYLKFKNKLEEQEESQDTTEDTAESVEEESTTTDMLDYENFSFTEEILEQIGYKKYFKKPLDEELVNSFTSYSVLYLSMFIFFAWSFYDITLNWESVIWIIVKIAMAVFVIVMVRMGIINILNARNNKRNILKICQYNKMVNNKSWVEIPSDDNDFNKYYDIAKHIIKNKIKLSVKNPEFKRHKYTEVYEISETNLVVVFGIYNLIKDDREYNLAFMIIVENDEYFLNVMGRYVLHTKR